jgi:DnaJ-domain-containing protein 1
MMCPLLQDRLDEEMQNLMEQLDARCVELGEDAKAAAQEVHPSLMYIR